MYRRQITVILISILAAGASSGPARIETTIASIRVDEASAQQGVHAQIEQRVQQAARDGARFIVLPEYAFARPERRNSAAQFKPQNIPGPDTEFLSGLTRPLKVWIVAGLAEQDSKGGFHSSVLLISPAGNVEQIHRKIIVRSGREDGDATRGNFRAVQDTIDANGIRIGIMPGDDIRIGIPRLAERGADVVFVPATWPEAEAKEWGDLCRELTAEYKVTIVIADRHGATGRVYFADGAVKNGREPIITATVRIARPGWSPVSKLGLPPTVPGRNFEPSGPELAELGRQLFFDTNMSSTRKVSCASCHQPDKAYTNGRQTGVGVHGRLTKRNVPSLLNVAFRPVLQWDGYATSIENFTKYPITNTSEMDFHYIDEVPKYVNSKPEYAEAFRRIFGVNRIEFPHVAKALATYERTLLSANSPFDRFFYGGESGALDASAKRGLALFRGKAVCSTCHAIGDRYALFLDFKFHVLGVGYDAATKTFADIGLAGISTADQEGLFQTPSLRDVALTAPYMHDGSLATLEEAVEFYNRGGVPNPQLDPAIRPLNLTAQEKRDLVRFMESLTGEHSGFAKPAQTQVAYGAN